MVCLFFLAATRRSAYFTRSRELVMGASSRVLSGVGCNADQVVLSAALARIPLYCRSPELAPGNGDTATDDTTPSKRMMDEVSAKRTHRGSLLTPQLAHLYCG